MTDRRLFITVLASLALHAAAVMAVLYFLRGGPAMLEQPDKPVGVELVMEEHKGDLTPPAAPSPTPAPAQPPQDPAPAEEPAPPTKPPVEARQDTPEQTPAPPETSRPSQSAPPPPPPAPTISLHGTDSPSEAKAFGADIIPAAPDAVFHNRPPDYPMAAARAGQQGTVILMIHISPSGQAWSVDIARSSGYPLLDQAAREAVMRWRFLPAVKDGRPIASDKAMAFEFAAQ